MDLDEVRGQKKKSKTRVTWSATDAIKRATTKVNTG
jgi:hypothetical protein